MQTKSKQQLKHNEIQPTLRYMASKVRETKMSTCHNGRRDAPRCPEKCGS